MVDSSHASLMQKLLSCIRERRLPYMISRILGNVKNVECSIYFDVAACNLRCAMCPNGGVSNLTNNSIGMMKYEFFKKIIDKFVTEKVRVRGIQFGNWGEPLLNRELPSMIRYARSAITRMDGQPIWININTNLNFLPDPIDLIGSGMDSMFISVSGMTQDTYQKNHIGGHINTALDNILRLAQAKKMATMPRLVMNWHDYIYNKNEQVAARQFCVENNIEFILLRIHICSVEDNIKYQTHKEELVSFYRNYIDLDEEKSLMTTLSDKKMKDCNLRKKITINTDGQLYPCCIVYEQKYFMGSIFDYKIKKILKMRPAICRQCAKTPMSWHDER